MTTRQYSVLLLSLALLFTMSIKHTAIADTLDKQQESRTHIYQPSYRTPQQLINAIQPLYAEQLALSTDGRVVLFKAPQKILSEVQELLPTLDHPPRQLTVELSNSKVAQDADSSGHTTKTYGTTQRNLPQSFTVTEGYPLTLLHQQQSQTLASSSLWWQEVSTIPNQQAYLQLTATVIGEQVYLDMYQQTLKHDKLSVYENSISGRINQWLSLSGATQGKHTLKTHSTRDRSLETLAIKVSITEQ